MNRRTLLLVLAVCGALLVAAAAGAVSRAATPAVLAPPPPAQVAPGGKGASGGQANTDLGSAPAAPAAANPDLPAAPAVGTPCAVTTTIQGSLASGDLQLNVPRLFRDGIQATCGAPKAACPGTSGTPPFYYDVYTFTNTTNSVQCVTASLFSAACNVQLSVYLNSFDPTNVCTNYLADPGLSTGAGGTVFTSFNVPANTDFVVVVNDPNAGLTGCGAYTLGVGGCPPPVQGTPTPTVTGTPPTATRTVTPVAGTPTPTASATATACVPAYTYTSTTGGTVVPGTVDTGNHTDDGATLITLPFPYQLYDQTFTTASVGSNGYLAFGTPFAGFGITCMPVGTATYHIGPYWTDQCTGPCATSTCTGCGIFTSVSGSAPNRVLNIEYRTNYYNTNTALDYEIRLFEGQTNYDVIYGTLPVAPAANDSALTVGVQKNPTSFTQVGCDATGGTAPPVSAGQRYTYTLGSCGAPTVTTTPTTTPANTATTTTTATPVAPTNTTTRTSTPVAPTNTATLVPTNTATTAPTQTPGGPSATPVPPSNTPARPSNTPAPPTVTSTPCAITFTDVNTTDYFYVPVQYLYCHGVISGYADGTFRPYNNTTRSQMVKIVVLGFNKPIQTPSGGGFTFTDVPPANPFFSVIETAAALNIVSGYNCGGPGEPCDANNRPYFRPFANVTRGQLSKIDVVAANWLLQNPANATFEDVLPNTAFYEFVETAAAHGVISGYNCGGPGEPCGSGNRPYFRQNNDATRGQISKIVYLSIVNGLSGNATGVAP